MARPKLWERQEGESSRAFAGFVLYRDMPADERSLRKVVEAHYDGSRSKLSQFSVWSREWRWVERSDAWDDEQDRLKLKAMARTHVKSAEQLAAISDGGLGLVIGWMKAKKADNLNDMAAIRLFEVAAKMKRLAIGLPSDVSRQEQTGKDGGPIQHEVAEVEPETDDERRARMAQVVTILSDVGLGGLFGMPESEQQDDETEPDEPEG